LVCSLSSDGSTSEQRPRRRRSLENSKGYSRATAAYRYFRPVEQPEATTRALRRRRRSVFVRSVRIDRQEQPTNGQLDCLERRNPRGRRLVIASDIRPRAASELERSSPLTPLSLGDERASSEVSTRSSTLGYSRPRVPGGPGS